MILTGEEITSAQFAGDIDIAPFDPGQINPNSYNFRLGSELVEVVATEPYCLGETIRMPDTGHVLDPGRLYLAATLERIGSRRYVTTLLGRSSIGRLGLFLNVSADLGHAGCDSEWTLELKTIHRLCVYPGMVIGQVAFWTQAGAAGRYDGRYHGDRGPRGSADPGLGLARQ